MTYIPLDELIHLVSLASDANHGRLDFAVLTQKETLTLLHYLKWIKKERIRKHKTEE